MLCVRGSWWLNKDYNILTFPASLDIAVCLSRSPGLLNRGPGAQLSAESLFTARSRILLQALNCNCSIGGPKGLLCWVLFSLQHPISNSLELPVYWFILLFYAHSISSHNWPTEYATSAVFGIAYFDHHQVEITVMQFTGHPLPVHQFVTVPWDFNPVPYCQPSSSTKSLPITGQRNMQLPPSL